MVPNASIRTRNGGVRSHPCPRGPRRDRRADRHRRPADKRVLEHQPHHVPLPRRVLIRTGSRESGLGSTLHLLIRFRSRQSGQGMVEYALILALVVLVVIIALIATGGQAKNLYSDIVTTMCNNHVGC